MYIRLNLATKPMVSHRRFFVGAGALGLLGLVLLGVFGWRYYHLRRADTELLAKTQKLQNERREYDQKRAQLDRFFSEQENATLQDRATFMNGVMEARSFNWTQMFMDLEKIMPPGARVVKIEPKLEKGTLSVKFVVGAANEEAKLKVLKAFEDSPSFSHVELSSEHATVGQQMGDPVTIEFTAIYTTI